MIRLPSLQTLRAFEAAGRHQSYSRAAEELGLTHGAISHRIRELEAETGARLFDRRGNRMLPTGEGLRLLVHVRHALGILEGAFARPAGAASGQVTVSVLPAFASRWLVPRLTRFRDAWPEVSVRLRVEVELTDFAPGGADAAIRFGRGGWPGLEAERLAGEWLFPVCAPAYRERLGLHAPADLSRATLLRHEWQPWGSWLQAAGLDIPEPSSGPAYADSALLLEAAEAGEGVALGRGLFAADELRSGQLVRLFDIAVPDAYSYYFVRPRRGAISPALTVFSTWLSAEMGVDASWVEAQFPVG